MKFENINTGNILTVENEDTIALMKGSANYRVVDKKTAKQTKSQGKDGNDGNDGGTTPPAE